MDKTIIYITDNILDKKIDKLCREHILKATKGYRLISVSHKPIDFGENICVGVKPRNSLTINLQMMEALKRVNTEHIAIAEADCLYTKEHFSFVPPNNNFWYNENVWCLQYYSPNKSQYNGMFSYFPTRKANSQLICRTEMMMESTQDRINMMADPAWKEKYPTGRIGEAGAMEYNHAMRLAVGESVRHTRGKLKEYISKYKGENWNTKIPNIDIRHNNNLTKNRRGYKRRYKIPYWGTIEDIFNGT